MIQLFTGTLASMVHVISGPDHLAAVVPLAIDSKNKSWSIGFFWGVGHTLGMLLIGILLLLIRDFIPIEQISAYSEQLVGFTLIFIGVFAIKKTLKPSKKNHSHKIIHTRLTAMYVGILHGLAGMSHFIAVSPILTHASTYSASFYLLGFALGTILAMVAFAFVLGYVGQKTDTSKRSQIFKILRISGGILSITVGIFWLFK